MLQPSGIVEIAPDIRRIANEMPARLQQKNPDALWFEMTVLVAIPNAPTTATVLGEFKTRCAVLPASAYSGQDDQGPMRKAMAALVKVARSPQGIGDPKWASACTFGDDRLAAAYNGVMQFPQNGIQARLFGKLVYLTSTDASIMFVF